MNNSISKIAVITACFCSAGVLANPVLPIEPVAQKTTRVESNSPSDNTVDKMLDSVVQSLPKSKRESLNTLTTPKTTASTLEAPKVDEFGRVIKSTPASAVSQATPQGQGSTANQTAPTLTPFEKMQREMAKKFKPEQEYKLRPGANITIPAAKFILNSIRTSFTEIEAKSSDPTIVVQVEGNFVYFTSDNDAPFGLILFEKGVPETQVNLTVWPLNVMPAMVDMKVRYGASLQKKVNQTLADRTQSQKETEARIKDKESELALSKIPASKNTPYLEQMYQITAQIAAKQNPTGFDLQTNIPENARFPCSFGTYAETKQRLISSRQIVDVVLVHNRTRKNIILQEQECWHGDDVIGTGILNKSTLTPNDKTEVYVVRDRLYELRRQQRNERPSLIN
ncbi:hypothetical protein ACRZ5S_23155 (plasmid) [Vibrio scophthalmi]|uniref:hypothetical protein n=1 Tax=Vibrio scophthalmi TaxID=45658 RepID=UPI003EC060FE